MKKFALICALSTTALLVGCGDSEEATNLPDNAPTEQNTMNQTSTVTETTDAPFNFTHFDLDIEYADDKSYDVSYENEASRAEAQIEDEVNNTKLEGNEATNKLVPIFESFTLDKDTPDDEVIDEVLQKFEQPDSFLELELEIKFADGTVKEYRRVAQ
ncbi:YusW family protein [Solibacillus sp. FSL R5-0449]|uniref:YusW family protein n=1 Tax=Solibacillus sp. FSL R5-0449 TaxID=2921639 RepID=UPI0030D1F9F9